MKPTIGRIVHYTNLAVQALEAVAASGDEETAPAARWVLSKIAETIPSPL